MFIRNNEVKISIISEAGPKTTINRELINFKRLVKNNLNKISKSPWQIAKPIMRICLNSKNYKIGTKMSRLVLFNHTQLKRTSICLLEGVSSIAIWIMRFTTPSME